VAFRCAVVLVVNLSGLWRSFAPDAGTWEMWGIQLSRGWSIFLAGHFEGLVNPHVIANAVLSSILGSSRIATSFFNTLFGISLAFIVRAIARHLYDERTAHRAFLLALFFPSIVLWQSQNLKDVWAQVAAAGLVLAVLRFSKGAGRGPALVLGGVCFALAVWTRPYLSVILLAAVVLSVMSAKPSRLPPAAMVVLLAIFGGKMAGLDDLLSTETLEVIDKSRKGLAYGGSAYGQDVDTTTLSGAISYFPEGMARFLFAPFLWEIDSPLQLMALPESLLFMWLTFQATRETLKGGLGRVWVLFSFFICIAGSYALASGNEGTAFRHRAQVMSFVIIVAAAHQIRRKREAEGVSSAELESGRVARVT
jgi:hypothetical protein